MLSTNKVLTIAAGATSSTGVVTITAVNDSTYTGDRQVTVKGAAANTVGARNPADVRLTITEDEIRPVQVEFGSGTYTAAEGGTVTVTVTLDFDPKRTVTIPIDKTDQDGAGDADYSGVPENVVFDSGDTEKTFTFTAASDNVDDDGESVKLTFGTLPAGVSEGSTRETVVTITDDDVPDVKVGFEQAAYTVDEGSSVSVKVTLDEAPERSVTIPINKTNQDEASDADYSGVPRNVTFGAAETEKTITFQATDDDADDDGESR